MHPAADFLRSCTLPAEHAGAIARILDAVRQAADPAEAVRRAWDGAELRSAGRVRLLAAGKASLAMARAAGDLLGSRLASALVVPLADQRSAASDQAGVATPAWRILPADHPRSTPRNERVAREVEAFVRNTAPDERLLFLLSGGASAQLALPADGLDVDELDALYADLRRAGAPIGDLNAVRKHCEKLKGGRLAAMCPAPVLVLVLSDVLGDPLDVIASGPAAPDPTTYADALAALDRSGQLDAHPRITEHLRAGANGSLPETPKPGDPALARATHRVIGGNRAAMDAAEREARALGFAVERSDGIEGEAMVAGELLAARLRRAGGGGQCAGCAPSQTCVLFGGETTVNVGPAHAPGARTGQGGPSQEMALAAAIALAGAPGVAGLAYSTDGIDGESDNAGAVFSGRTIALARAKGLDPESALAAHDSGGFFEALGDQIRTGATGTNVNHVACVLAFGTGGLPG